MNFNTSESGNLVSAYFADLSRESRIDFEELRRLVALAQRNNKAARDKVIRANLKFVVSVARRYLNKGLEFADLIAEGNTGLFDAIRKYDITSGYQFDTYAVHWIEYRIRSAIEENNAIHVPHRTKVDRKDFIPTSLDANLGDDENSATLSDMIADQSYLSIEDSLVKKEMANSVIDLMGTLNEREQYVIKSYYGFFGEKKSLRAIGDELNLSKGTISLDHVNALKKMRAAAKEMDLNLFAA